MKKRLICGVCHREFDTWLEVADHKCKEQQNGKK